ncbi:MAG TPA: hypothetical protein VFG69_19065 [Nannocystaceae bacterium]|nr:hypothetical protein [Nannocystaceae bacterium]
MKTRLLTLSLPLTFTALLGCPSGEPDPMDTGADDESSDDANDDANDDASDDGSSDDGSSDDGSDDDASDTGEPAGCLAPTQGPTHHDEDIVGHEVWTADASPHLVDWTVDVRDGATLEIEPCAVVQFAAGHGLNVAYPGTPTTGTLIAQGTEERPIRFEGRDGGRWGHLFVQAPGTASLAWVTFADGGGVDTRGASLIASGTNELPTPTPLFVDHVTVTGSQGAGVVVDRIAGFAAGSTDLVVAASGDAAHPYPLVVGEHTIGSIPAGSYTGNAVDEILIDPEHSLAEDATMRELGVPYVVAEANDLVVASGDENAPATLTIEPGVRIELAAGRSLEIEHYTGEFMASGALVALGTAEQPIVFTSASPTPQPGDWTGLWFGGIVQPTTQLDHVRVEYTGAWCGCILSTCSDIDEFEGAVIMSQEPDHVFVTNSLIADGSSHGFVLGYDGSALDFAAVNEFEGMGGCPMTLPRDGACPSPLPSCME